MHEEGGRGVGVKVNDRLTWMSLPNGLRREHERAIVQQVTHISQRGGFRVLSVRLKKVFLGSHQWSSPERSALYSSKSSLREK